VKDRRGLARVGGQGSGNAFLSRHALDDGASVFVRCPPLAGLASRRWSLLRGGRGLRLQTHLPRQRMLVMLEHEIDALADVNGNRNLRPFMEQVQPLVLLRRYIDGRGNFLP